VIGWTGDWRKEAQMKVTEERGTDEGGTEGTEIQFGAMPLL